MKSRLARTAGFCMGVRRAMELALDAAHGQDGPISTYGPLIHNPQVLDMLETKGIAVLEEIPEADSQEGGTVIIRAHGVPPEMRSRLKEAGFSKVINGTCPRVVKVQAIIRRSTRQGKHTVIVGDVHHPEVVGLLGHAGDMGHVISREEEVDDLPPLDEVVVVAQTTQSGTNFEQVVSALEKRIPQVEVNQTICEATHRRQNEVRRLANEVDGVVVVGGRNSGNTKRLAELAGEGGKPVFLIETEQDLDKEALCQLGSVGVTAGASTPNWMIKRVMREVGAIRSIRDNPAAYWFSRILRFLVRSQMLVALGAAGMTLASSLLQGATPQGRLITAAALYIYAMHILNHFLDKEAGKYNDPDRSHFLAKHRGFLIGSGVASAFGSMSLCLEMGWWPLGLITVMSVLGLLYTAPLLPGFVVRGFGFQRLKDIPGSKTFSASLAWAFVVAVLPAVALEGALLWGTVLAFMYTLCLVFVRCSLFDILDVQGDLIVGKETIPILLGERKTIQLLVRIVAGLALLLLAAGFLNSLTWVMILPLGGMAFMILALTRSWLNPGAVTEGLVDLNFLLAGALAWLWWPL
jgi:(E)-4-hydroxy-3-methyl-but-2-enyl pyrophosphate reductase